MSFRTRLVVFGYPLAEILAFWALGLWLGWLLAIVIILAGFPIGFALWRNAASAAQLGQPDKASVFGIAGLLFVIPGVLTDLLALVLLIPAVHKYLGKRLTAWTGTTPMARFTYTNAGASEVVIGEVVEPDGPVIIRGVIESPGDLGSSAPEK